MSTVLLLAGTAEARQLALAQGGDGGSSARRMIPTFAEMTSERDATPVRLIASLAGVTDDPLPYPCETRSGGFGGADGLRAYLEQENIAAVIDATHPFAVEISRNASGACRALGVPLLALVRPAWEPVGHWRDFGTLDEAVAALPSGARVLATTGRKDVEPYVRRPDLQVFLRSVDAPATLPAHVVPVTARGPFGVDDEMALMQEHGITHLLTRNAGGESRARLEAATALDLPMHVVARPVHPAATVAQSVAEALRWLDRVLLD